MCRVGSNQVFFFNWAITILKMRFRPFNLDFDFGNGRAGGMCNIKKIGGEVKEKTGINRRVYPFK